MGFTLSKWTSNQSRTNDRNSLTVRAIRTDAVAIIVFLAFVAVLALIAIISAKLGRAIAIACLAFNAH